MKTLIIIDMQVALFEQAKRYDEEGVVSRINELSKFTRHNGGKVIFVQHNGEEEEGLAPGSVGWGILPTLDMKDEDIIINKTICDSFYQTTLNKTLSDLGSKEIFITGCATDFCVDTTLRSAISHGYQVTAPSDCHTTGDRPHLSAKKVIDHHNWLWRNLITPNKLSAVCVVPVEQIIATTSLVDNQ